MNELSKLKANIRNYIKSFLIGMKFYKNYFIYIFVFLILGCGTISLEYSAEIKDPEEVTIEFEFIATDLATSVFVDDINEDFKFSSNNPIPISPVSEFLKDWDVEIINEDFAKVRYIANKTFKGSEAKEFLNPKYQDEPSLDVFPRFLMTESHERGEIIYKFSMIPSWFGEKSWEDSFVDRGFSEDEFNSLRFDLEEWGGIVTLDIKLKIFGEIVDSNADKQEGNQLIWRFDFERIFETREKEVPYVITKQKKGFVSSLFGSCNMPDDTEIEKIEKLTKNNSKLDPSAVPTPSPVPTPSAVPTPSPVPTQSPVPIETNIPKTDSKKSIIINDDYTPKLAPAVYSGLSASGNPTSTPTPSLTNKPELYGIIIVPVVKTDYLIITYVSEGSSAQDNGILPADKIYEINGYKVSKIYEDSSYNLKSVSNSIMKIINKSEYMKISTDRLGVLTLEKKPFETNMYLDFTTQQRFNMYANIVEPIEIRKILFDYDRDPISAEKNYDEEKRIVIHGVISQIMDNQIFQYIQFMHPEPMMLNMPAISLTCYFNENSNPKGVKHLKRGDSVYMLATFYETNWMDWPDFFECGDMTKEINELENYVENLEKSKTREIVVVPSPSPSPSPTPTPTPTPTPKLQKIKISANDLLSEFDSDSEASSEKYNNEFKVLEVTGIVNSINIQDFRDPPYFEIGTGIGIQHLYTKTVFCGLDNIDNLSEMKEEDIKLGDEVKIQGIYEEYDIFNVKLLSCKLIKEVLPVIASADDSILKAVDIILEFENNPERSLEKYKSKEIKIIGNIFDLGRNNKYPWNHYVIMGSNRLNEKIKINCSVKQNSVVNGEIDTQIKIIGTLKEYLNQRIVLEDCTSLP